MAMDYLPIQATSVPCERIFSSSAETDTKRRNRINPILMEALQMEKLFHKKRRLAFTEGWMAEEKDLSSVGPDEDPLVKLSSSDDPKGANLDAVIRYMDQYDTELEAAQS